ncbi:MAG: DUF523 domain-containing protein [Clostridia bacterium]|nr:DUF523 domain-containing protein [Clostridia bacterium]
MEHILISACLLGVVCRYDGLSKPIDRQRIDALKEKYHLIPICPEIMGGLPTPRIPAEINAERRVLRRDGADVTENYRRGAEEALRLAKLFDCKIAILKERSPSCSTNGIYDGTFSKTLTDGEGIAAEYLRNAGLRVLGESDIEKLRTENF